MAQNNSQIKELHIAPRYTVMKLKNPQNKEKGRGKKTYKYRGKSILTNTYQQPQWRVENNRISSRGQEKVTMTLELFTYPVKR